MEEKDNTKYLKDPLRQLRTLHRAHIRLTLLYGGVILLALVLLGWNTYRQGVAAEIQGLQHRLLAVVTSLASSIQAADIEAIPAKSTQITLQHQELLRRFRQVAQQDPDIETIYILRPTMEPTKLRFVIDYAKSGEVGEPGELYDATDVPVMLQGFAHPAVEDEPYSDEFGTTLSGYAPIVTQDGRSVGLVGVDVDVSRLDAIQKEVLGNVATTFGIAIILLASISWYVAKSVRQPLSRIINAATAISHGKLDTRIAMRRNDELGLMSKHIDQMAEQLQEREFIRETFGRYVSEDIAETLLAEGTDLTLGGEERIVTVLFSDLQGYSTMSEHMPPAKVVEMLNSYLGAITEIIHQHGGCVIEFIGDAIFAVFGAPHQLSGHSEKAVQCAIAMRERLVQLNREWQDTGLANYWKDIGQAQVTARIGIHTGHVVAGNLGSPTRMKYAVIGDTVNIAARLEALNKELGTDILISRAVYTNLSPDLTRELLEQGEYKVKGREQAIKVYSINKPKPKLSVLTG